LGYLETKRREKKKNCLSQKRAPERFASELVGTPRDGGTPERDAPERGAGGSGGTKRRIGKEGVRAGGRGRWGASCVDERDGVRHRATGERERENPVYGLGREGKEKKGRESFFGF